MICCPSALGPLRCGVLVLWGHQCSPDALGPLACGALVLEGHLGVVSKCFGATRECCPSALLPIGCVALLPIGCVVPVLWGHYDVLS